MKTKLDHYSYIYKKLKAKYPQFEDFYITYVPGGYFNTDYSIYYDELGNELETESHGNYG